MDAFISYSHADKHLLDIFHKHLTQLRRDNILDAWTDEEILAGQRIEGKISSRLNRSDIFIALLSPDYIASNYCYEKEFEAAIILEKSSKMIIIPVILEPCDWLNTPFKQFKALPKDGKAVSTWENQNTAFLDVIQNLRRLLESTKGNKTEGVPLVPALGSVTRNYRVQKDFDTIEKMEFTEKTFHEVKEFLKRYLEEIIQIENIKARVLSDDKEIFECILVNRNKINSEAKLRIVITKDKSGVARFLQVGEMNITCTIEGGSRPNQKTFGLSHDEYHLMWSEDNGYSNSRQAKELISKDMADVVWNAWLESVGII